MAEVMPGETGDPCDGACPTECVLKRRGMRYVAEYAA